MNGIRALSLMTCLALAGPGAAAQNRPITVTRLTDKLYLLSVDETNYSTNALAFVGPDGVLLVDTQSPEDSSAFRQALEGLGAGLVRYIINTHRHIEHIGGNAAFGPAPVVIAHALVPTKLRSRTFLFEEFPPTTFPDITVADSLTLFFNGERIRIVALSGSHDDNELFVHFVDEKVVHLSSVVNGFNFPSVDDDGDALRFPELAERAMALLPHDVAIVSGHNPLGEHRAGSWSDLQPYHDAIARTIGIVRDGLARGADVATLQRDSVLREFGAFARNYVDENAWIATLAARLRRPPGPRPPMVFAALYETWKSRGAAAALARYVDLRANHAAEYRFSDRDLLIIGDRLLERRLTSDAAVFLEGSLREYPDAPLNYLTNYDLALAQRDLGNIPLARQYCQRALELNPQYQRAATLLAELNRG